MLAPSVVTNGVQAVADEWTRRAAERREVTPSDVAADALEFCAADLRRQLEGILGNARMVGVEEYADLYGKTYGVTVTPQTVRKWIRGGKLPAVPGRRRNTYLVRADARPIGSRL